MTRADASRWPGGGHGHGTDPEAGTAGAGTAPRSSEGDLASRPAVLVVDDEDGVRSTVAEILRGAGYQVTEAPDGNAALALLDAGTSDVMILDVVMPERDGIALLEALPTPPVTIMISGHDLEVDAQERVGSKIFAMLEKPFRPERLIEMVQAALEPYGGE